MNEAAWLSAQSADQVDRMSPSRAIPQKGTISFIRWDRPVLPHAHARLSWYDGTADRHTAMMFEVRADHWNWATNRMICETTTDTTETRL